MNDSKLSRRKLLKAAGASALIVSFLLKSLGSKAHSQSVDEPRFLNAYIAIDSDNHITIFMGSTEMGQGILTVMAQLVAEQLKQDWSKVTVEHGHPDETQNGTNPYVMPGWFLQLTGGSTSTMMWSNTTSTAAATVREMLLAAAGAGWVVAGNGTLRNTTSSEVRPYSAFVEATYAYYFGDSNPTPQAPRSTLPVISWASRWRGLTSRRWLLSTKRCRRSSGAAGRPRFGQRLCKTDRHTKERPVLQLGVKSMLSGMQVIPQETQYSVG